MLIIKSLKSMKLSTFIFSSIFLFSFLSCTAQSSSVLATARIIDLSIGTQETEILVVYENGESESIPLKNISLADLKNIHAVDMNALLLENQKTITSFLNDMDQKGYKIEEMEYSVNNGHFSFIVFRKT